jgi:putative adhesin
MTLRPWLVLTTLSLAPLANAHGATPVDREIDADAKGILEVSNVAGSVEIRGSNRRNVHVSGTLGDDVERLDVERSGNRVIVRVVLREHPNWRGDTSLTIEAPQANDIFVDVVSARVDVSGIEGEQRVNSVSGSITTQAFASDLNLSSVSGSVNAQGQGRAAMTRARSISGSVELAGLAGQVQAETVSGRLDVSVDDIERATLSSISGTVSLHGSLRNDARVELTSTSGSLRLLLEGPAAAEYDLTSFSGPIKSCFGPAVTETRYGPQRAQRFTEGTSDARVHASSMSGGIDLCRE